MVPRNRNRPPTDHCGGNHLLAGRPIYVQRRELGDARGEDYTIHEWVEAPGARPGGRPVIVGGNGMARLAGDEYFSPASWARHAPVRLPT